MYPSEGVGLKDVEFFVVPTHDSIAKQKHPKAFVITGAPTRIFEEKIPETAKQWEKVFASLPRPWISVIVGGAIKGKPWPEEEAKELLYQVKNIQEKIVRIFSVQTLAHRRYLPSRPVLQG